MNDAWQGVTPWPNDYDRKIVVPFVDNTLTALEKYIQEVSVKGILQRNLLADISIEAFQICHYSGCMCALSWNQFDQRKCRLQPYEESVHVGGVFVHYRNSENLKKWGAYNRFRAGLVGKLFQVACDCQRASVQGPRQGPSPEIPIMY